MDRESVDRLRFDRRLQRRRDWVSDEDLNAHIDSLPDVSDKMTTAAELEAEEAASAGAETVEETPEAPTTGFGAPTTLGGGGFTGGSTPLS